MSCKPNFANNTKMSVVLIKIFTIVIRCFFNWGLIFYSCFFVKRKMSNTLRELGVKREIIATFQVEFFSLTEPNSH